MEYKKDGIHLTSEEMALICESIRENQKWPTEVGKSVVEKIKTYMSGDEKNWTFEVPNVDC